MNPSSRPSTAKRASRAIARAVAWGALLVLPSCLPQLRQAEPGAGLPEGFKGGTVPEAAGADNSSRLGIEEFYNDQVLTRLIHQALFSNQELKILNEEVQIARNEILARRGAYLPFIGFRGAGGLDKPSAFTPL